MNAVYTKLLTPSKRRIALSIFIMNTTFVYTMENHSSFLSSFSLYSLLPAWFSTHQMHESKAILDLRTSKNKLEKQVSKQLALFRNPYMNPKDDMSPAYHNFITFFYHCYYPRNQNYKDHLILTSSELTHYRTYRISLIEDQQSQNDDYSFLAIGMIAKDGYFFLEENISTKEKRFFMKKLLQRGFSPTQKDLELATLILYDEVSERQMTMLYLLHTNSQATWSVLLPEIRIHIARCLIELFKKKFWLLPGH